MYKLTELHTIVSLIRYQKLLLLSTILYENDLF